MLFLTDRAWGSCVKIQDFKTLKISNHKTKQKYENKHTKNT